MVDLCYTTAGANSKRNFCLHFERALADELLGAARVVAGVRAVAGVHLGVVAISMLFHNLTVCYIDPKFLTVFIQSDTILTDGLILTLRWLSRDCLLQSVFPHCGHICGTRYDLPSFSCFFFSLLQALKDIELDSGLSKEKRYTGLFIS